MLYPVSSVAFSSLLSTLEKLKNYNELVYLMPQMVESKLTLALS